MSNFNPLAKILDTNHLTGPNFDDWLRNLKIILTSDKIAYVLDGPMPESLPEGSSEEELDILKEWQEADIKVRCYMLSSMSNEL